MRAKIKGAFLMPELVVLSAMLVFAGIAAADDGLNLVGGIADESGIGNADVKIGNSDTATTGGYVADELLLLSDDESCPSVLYIPELATIAAPLVSILGLLLFFNRRKLREEN
jgi:hypothetical protein